MSDEVDIEEIDEDKSSIPAFKYNKVGKPPKLLSDLALGWQDLILNEMAQGASRQEIKALLRITNDQHSRWMKVPEDENIDNYAEYREIIKQGELLCEAWWQKAGRTHLKSHDFSATLWYMNMKNRFGWKDKSEVSNSDPERDKILKKVIEMGGVKVEFG